MTEPRASDDMPPPAASEPQRRAGAYAWYVLGILFLVYVVNYIDRQIISIIAEDIKRDLKIPDEQLGFLYGTAFGIFYALFGIPLGRLADNWRRVNVLVMGLGLWSVMTILSGLSRNGLQLSAARMGVGIGEGTASPSAYSLLSDLFPRRLRATAIAIYSAGIFIGGGGALLFGGLIVQRWNALYPQGGPFGLVGWQVAFIAAGLPGLVLAAWVATVEEPVRGAIDGFPEPAPHPAPFRAFLSDLIMIVPPLTLFGAARRGRALLVANLLGLAVIAAVVAGLLYAGESAAQWVTVGVGVYAVFSWGQILRHEDPPTFRLTIGSAAFICTILAYSLNMCLHLAAFFWTAPHLIRELGVSPAQAGLYLGSFGAIGGFAGMTSGGILADRLRRGNPAGRIAMLLASAVLTLPFVIANFATHNATIAVAAFCGMQFFTSWGLSAAAATTQDLVLPRMRGTAAGIFLVNTTMLAFAIGPYVAGRISTATGSIATGVLWLLPTVPAAIAVAIAAYRLVPVAEVQRDANARAAGEVI